MTTPSANQPSATHGPYFIGVGGSGRTDLENQRLSEQDAFARLRRASQTSGRPMRLIAETIIETLAE